MARHRNQTNAFSDRRNHWVTEEAIQDGLAVEVSFLFESIEVSTSEGTQAGLRLFLFMWAEANRAANGHDGAAYRNDTVLGRILEALHAADEEIRESPNCLEANKRKQAILARSSEPLIAILSLLSSMVIRMQYIREMRPQIYIKLIKPYFLEDRAWKRARSRFNSFLKKRGIALDFEVGDRKPPLESRFKKSGNLKGRPPKKTGLAAAKALRESPLKVKTKSGAYVMLNRRDHKLKTIFRRAMEGDAVSRRELMMLIEYLHERRLLIEPPSKKSAKKSKLNEEQREKLSKLIALAIEWGLAHFRTQYGRAYGSIVDFEARIGLSDEDKALMEEVDKKNQAERELSLSGVSTASLYPSGGSTSKTDRAYPTIPRLRSRENGNGLVAQNKRKSRANTAQGGTRKLSAPGDMLVPPYPSKPRSRTTPLSQVSQTKKTRKT